MDCEGSRGFAISLHACDSIREPEQKTFGALISYGLPPFARHTSSDFGCLDSLGLPLRYTLTWDSMSTYHDRKWPTPINASAVLSRTIAFSKESKRLVDMLITGSRPFK